MKDIVAVVLTAAAQHITAVLVLAAVAIVVAAAQESIAAIAVLVVTVLVVAVVLIRGPRAVLLPVAHPPEGDAEGERGHQGGVGGVGADGAGEEPGVPAATGVQHA